jgi:ribose-phosphate pyrophosphokinase
MSYVVFSTTDYEMLASKITQAIRGVPGELETKNFGDGERYYRIRSLVRDQDVVLVGGTINDKASLDLFDLACGLVDNGCRSLKIVIPFFGYSTMERAVHAGEVVTAKTRARLLSAIPTAPFGNEVVMLDLHSEGIPFYFEGAVKTRHLYAKSLILKEAKRLGGANFILGAPDAGRAKWVESLANDLGVPAGFVYKRRADDGSVSISGVNVIVGGANVVIYDDMIRSGQSILQAAQAYQAAGAKKISLITTHGLFTGDAVERLKKGGVISSVSCTDSHPNAIAIQDPFVQVMSTTELFSNYLNGARDVNR